MEDSSLASPMVAPVPGGRLFAWEVRAGLADAAPSGRVRLDAVARWLQDVAYLDLDDVGLADRAGWVVRRTRLRVHRFPRFGDDLSVRTFCSGLGRFWAERRTTVAADGDALVDAEAIWIHLDRETQRPARFDPASLTLFRSSAGDRQVKARLRHRAPDESAGREPWRFLATDLDLAGHVNNAAYWQLVEEELHRFGEPPALDAEIEYRAPSGVGAAELLREPGRLWLADAGGELLASAAYAPRRA